MTASADQPAHDRTIGHGYHDRPCRLNEAALRWSTQLKYRHFAPTASPTGLLGRVIGVLAGALLLVAGLFFSVILLATVAVLGVLAVGYFWWKTRALRQQLRDMPPMHTPASEETGTVYEGESIRVVSIEDKRGIEDGKPPA